MPKPNTNSKPISFQLHEGNTSMKFIGLVVAIALFFIGIIAWVTVRVNSDIDKANPNSEVASREKNGEPEPELPDSLAVPLHNKNRIEQVTIEDEENIILFYSNSSVDKILDFYKDWSKNNEYVFVDKEKELAKTNLSNNQYTFALIPAIGRNNLMDYHFTVETIENATKIIVSYREASPTRPIKENNTIPKDFKLKF